ncbi:MAG: DUF4924 family protein [Crocinitomicaceae bacterium]|nr:DUF4924 family protein [Crocinitomicaceae bacterium]
MLIAQQKYEENIAEYILYMYQIEDVIRAYNFDLDLLVEQFIKPQVKDESTLIEYRKWYRKLINDMKDQRIEKTGHLLDLNETLIELSYLHNALLGQANDTSYIQMNEKAQSFINEFKDKSNLKEKNDVELIFGAMYMKLLLRLQKKNISSETETAFEAMRAVLAYLAKSYHKMKKGDLDFLKN